MKVESIQENNGARVPISNPDVNFTSPSVVLRAEYMSGRCAHKVLVKKTLEKLIKFELEMQASSR